ncbi:GGDEF domain-containing protein [Nakamurella flava]|uniref:GGDEF domain-containing protein n=1 Tax=Nakamurella flava TaxID=2576308 RepID=A0A4U6QA92_9ACTN|nr:GGDEF domain-containing protein [Nakamurella flava]TKV56836.1 GGDEF domain-containing protein [Nakamurella flava]
MSSSAALQLPWRATPPRFRLVLVLTAALWLITLALALGPLGVDSPPVNEVLSAPGFWIVVALVLLADCYPWLPSMRDVRGELRFVWSAPLSLGAIVAFGAPAVLLPAVSGLLTSLARGTAPWWRSSINAMCFGLIGSISLLLVELAREWTTPQPTADPLHVTVVGLLVAVVALGVNGSVLAVASATLGRSTVAASWRQTRRALRIWGISLVAVPLVATLAVAAPWAGLPVVIVIAALNQLSRTMLRSTAAARTDPLTRLANRVTLTRRLATRISAVDVSGSGSGGTRVYLLLIDLDGFKSVNDTHGHLLGDAVLRRVADRLRSAVPAGDLVARYGGDEFAVVPGPGSTASIAVETAERIQRALAEPLRLGGQTITVGASIGLAATADPRTDVLELVEMADRDLYRVKKSVALVERRLPVVDDEPEGGPFAPVWSTAAQGAITAPATGWPGVHWSITAASPDPSTLRVTP